MNTYAFTGRLTQDPSLRTRGELKICDMRVAIPRRRSADGSDRGAVFIDLTTFNGLATICGEHLEKGRQVAVVGRIELDEWKAEDGTPRRRHKVIADEIEFLGKPTAKAEPAESEPAVVAA